MTTTDNFFELFSLPEQFDIDVELLQTRYRDLQRATHPDRFAAAGDRERRLAVQQAARVNDAYQTLKSALPRARYLLQLRGVNVDDDSNTAMDGDFLMQQMELREALSAVADAADAHQALADIGDRLRELSASLQDDIRRGLAAGDAATLVDVADRVRRLMFIERLWQDMAQLESELD